MQNPIISANIDSLTELIAKRWRADPHNEINQDADEQSSTFVASEGPNADLRGLIPYGPNEFESDMQRLLDFQFPYACLPGVQIFSPRKRGLTNWGAEIDHLLHFREAGTDHDVLVLVEVKKQSLEVSDKGWRATYRSGPKCCKKQVDRQIRTLWEYIRPISSTNELKFMGLVVSIDPSTVRADARGYRGSELSVLPAKDLITFLCDKFSLKDADTRRHSRLRMVSQSPFLSLLRLSNSIPSLGHPELKSAITYVKRCRRSLDESLFKDFKPQRDRWAINGSAGMGKSVLLAYTAAVLCSGYELAEFDGEVYAAPAKGTLKKTGFKNDHKLSIGILAMSTKQLASLREWFQFFIDRFQEKDESGNIRFRRPEFLLAKNKEKLKTRKWSALIVDECHDIHPRAAEMLVNELESQDFFLVVGCDRHQKLRLTGKDSRILNGVDFSLKTTRLKQIYRNPSAVYIASLALMFRWFADGGLKVIPTKEQLQGEFGFEVEGERKTGYKISIQSDAHPGNAWSHTVGSFPDVQSAFRHIEAAHLSREDVLWARFSDEDPDFDYESLSDTAVYHVCRSKDADKISDKYIKGQDYPVVIIEGFPKFMDKAETPDQEEKMWAFRRELYLCASRATCFLYFVARANEAPEIVRIQNEINSLVKSLCEPSNPIATGTKTWGIGITPTETTRTLDVFIDTEPEEDLAADEAIAEDLKQEDEGWELWVEGPISVRDFATEVDIKPFQALAELIKMEVFVTPTGILDFETLKELTKRFGGTLRVNKPEEITVVADESEEQEIRNEEITSPSPVSNKSDGKESSQEDRRNENKEPPRPKLRPPITADSFKAKVQESPSIKSKKPEKSKPTAKAKPRSPAKKQGAKFMIGPNVFVRAGHWIDDYNYGLGCIIQLNTKPGYADSHNVWFAEKDVTMYNTQLRGRVNQVIIETKIPKETREKCPTIVY